MIFSNKHSSKPSIEFISQSVQLYTGQGNPDLSKGILHNTKIAAKEMSSLL